MLRTVLLRMLHVVRAGTRPLRGPGADHDVGLHSTMRSALMLLVVHVSVSSYFLVVVEEVKQS